MYAIRSYYAQNPPSTQGNIVAVVELTKENFESTITGNAFVIVDFWAPWCGPCRSFAPTYEKVSEDFADVVFGKVNTEEEQELASGRVDIIIGTHRLLSKDVAFKRLGLLIVDEEHRFGVSHNRITSYNVCYTKLLRP